MEYMRTLLRDNELFRTYVTVSPTQPFGDPIVIFRCFSCCISEMSCLVQLLETQLPLNVLRTFADGPTLHPEDLFIFAFPVCYMIRFPSLFWFLSVGRDAQAVQSAEAGRHGGEASPEAHQVSAPAEEHPEEDGRAGHTRRPQQHGEHFTAACSSACIRTSSGVSGTCPMRSDE